MNFFRSMSNYSFTAWLHQYKISVIIYNDEINFLIAKDPLKNCLANWKPNIKGIIHKRCFLEIQVGWHHRDILFNIGSYGNMNKNLFFNQKPQTWLNPNCMNNFNQVIYKWAQMDLLFSHHLFREELLMDVLKYCMFIVKYLGYFFNLIG